MMIRLAMIVKLVLWSLYANRTREHLDPTSDIVLRLHSGPALIWPQNIFVYRWGGTSSISFTIWTLWYSLGIIIPIPSINLYIINYVYKCYLTRKTSLKVYTEWRYRSRGAIIWKFPWLRMAKWLTSYLAMARWDRKTLLTYPENVQDNHK